MQFSEEWLRSMVATPLAAADLAHALTMAGLEVEDMAPVPCAFAGVTVGLIVTSEPHPGAARLRLCTVDTGQGALHAIVCGAPNATVGLKVPVAGVGARLPGDAGNLIEVQRATIRGVASEGMLCSARELGLSEDHAGLLALPADAVPGADVRDVLGLNDNIFTIKLTPNRADCLSVLGVAREVAAICGTQIMLGAAPKTSAVTDEIFPVTISATPACGRFTGRVIRDVNAAVATPPWMRRRLQAAGQRSISALVDITNYVMLERGRPLHVYDLDKLTAGIDVRFGRAGEQLELLNEQTVEVDGNVLVIADASGAIGLAGIMGGNSTKAETTTTNVLLESAFFLPEAIAGRARRFGCSSDASHRFERGVDFDNNIDGIERATELILSICGGRPGPVDDRVAELPTRHPVTMRADRARRIIGVSVADAEMAAILARLGLAASFDAGRFSVVPPTYRFDIVIEDDLIEEIARIYGFDRIPALPPVARSSMTSVPEARRSIHAVRDVLVGLDYHEVVNYSFVDRAWETGPAGNASPIELRNPIASHLAVMRSSLFGGLCANVVYNLNRRQDRVRVFEIGRVFYKDPGAVDASDAVAGLRQPVMIGGAACGSSDAEQWGTPRHLVDFFDIKGDVEALLAPTSARFEAFPHPAMHPGRSARVWLGDKVVGWVGELHPRWQQWFELPTPVQLFELDTAAAQSRALPAYRGVPRVPAVRRDLAVLVDEKVTCGDLLAALKSGLPAVVDAVEVFDLYAGKGVGEGKKSLAFRVLLQDTQKTLTDAEVDEMINLAVSILHQQFGATLRQ